MFMYILPPIEIQLGSCEILGKGSYMIWLCLKIGYAHGIAMNK